MPDTALVKLATVSISCGIFQGDTLSPLLFCVALNPLSLLLDNVSGYQATATRQLNHLLYMDDLKLFAKSDVQLETLLRTVHMFSTDVCLAFGLDKCAKLSVVRGKVVSSGSITLSQDVDIHELNVGECYKYLGFFEAEGLDCNDGKQKILELYKKRLSLIWKSYLSGPRKVRATNSFCVPVLSYGFGVIPWTKQEISHIDVQTRKLLTATNNHHPRSAVERLYLPRSAGGLGLVNVENLFYRRLVALACHLCQSADALVGLCQELDRTLPARRSVMALASGYCCSLGVPFECNSCDSMRGVLSKKQLQSLTSSLLEKPLHGHFYSFINTNTVDKQRSFVWLKQHLHSETESTIIAVQNQVLATRVIEARVMHKSVPSLGCRLCGQVEETIVHLLSACPVLAPTAYLHRHNLVASVVHLHLMNTYSFVGADQSWCSHKPPPVLESSTAKILWDFTLHTDHHHSSNRPDIVLFEYCEKRIYFIEISCPADVNVQLKEVEKLSKYRDLANDFHQMYGMQVTTIPVVLGCTGVVSTTCLSHLKKIPNFSSKLFANLQKAAIIGTIRTLRVIPFI